jgi:hypothetical protein
LGASCSTCCMRWSRDDACLSTDPRVLRSRSRRMRCRRRRVLRRDIIVVEAQPA